MNENAIWAIFPFAFIALWLMIVSILGAFSGWYSLQGRFPDTGEQAMRKLRFRSGLLGSGSLWNPWGNVSYGGCLRLDICRTGLRVRIWRIFGPFCGPILVPWNQISVEEKRILFVRRYRLHFAPDLSILTISSWTFNSIADSELLQYRPTPS
jgi:hypothetical protein